MTGRPDSYFTMYVGDYLRDTMHLNTRQHGAYQLLLMHYYGTGRPLPLEDDTLRAITREQPSEWKVDRSLVMAYFTKEQDGWHQKRADKELTSAAARYQRAVAGAKAKHTNKQRSSIDQAGNKQPSEHDPGTCLNDANLNPPPTEKSPTGFSSDRSARPAARGRTAAPVALGPGWEALSPKWAAFREKIGDSEWQLWFAKCRINGSETSLIADSAFSAEKIELRFGDQLAVHFLSPVTIHNPKSGATPHPSPEDER